MPAASAPPASPARAAAGSVRASRASGWTAVGSIAVLPMLAGIARPADFSEFAQIAGIGTAGSLLFCWLAGLTVAQAPPVTRARAFNVTAIVCAVAAAMLTAKQFSTQLEAKTPLSGMGAAPVAGKGSNDGAGAGARSSSGGEGGSGGSGGGGSGGGSRLALGPQPLSAPAGAPGGSRSSDDGDTRREAPPAGTQDHARASADPAALPVDDLLDPAALADPKRLRELRALVETLDWPGVDDLPLPPAAGTRTEAGAPAPAAPVSSGNPTAPAGTAAASPAGATASATAMPGAIGPAVPTPATSTAATSTAASAAAAPAAAAPRPAADTRAELAAIRREFAASARALLELVDAARGRFKSSGGALRFDDPVLQQRHDALAASLRALAQRQRVLRQRLQR